MMGYLVVEFDELLKAWWGAGARLRLVVFGVQIWMNECDGKAEACKRKWVRKRERRRVVV